MQISRVLVFSAACSLTIAPLPAFVGGDDFNGSSMNTSQWTVAQAQGNAAFSQTGDGVLHYTADPGTSNDGTAWAWILGTASVSSDWSVRLDVANPGALNQLASLQYANIGVGVRDTSNLGNNGFSVRLDKAYVSGDPQTRQWEADKEALNTGTIIESSATTAQSGAVLITWTAATHILTAAFATNGGAGGYSWTSFSTYDPVTAWSMDTGTGSFTFVLTANSLNTDILAADGITADNFNLIDSATVTLPIPELSATGLGYAVASLLVAFLGARRRAKGESGPESAGSRNRSGGIRRGNDLQGSQPFQ